MARPEAVSVRLDLYTNSNRWRSECGVVCDAEHSDASNDSMAGILKELSEFELRQRRYCRAVPGRLEPAKGKKTPEVLSNGFSRTMT
jgi:hypothetical protein